MMGLIMRRSHLCKFCIIVIVLISPVFVYAFDTKSHKNINELAAQVRPSLDNYLKNTLGLLLGMDTVLYNNWNMGMRVLDWITEGGAAEDQLWFRNFLGETLGGLFRSIRHFHQPLRSWDQAGFKKSVSSSIYWAQDKDQWPGRNASWFDGRNSYLIALLSPTDKQRQDYFSETFQTVGQLMHLVSDAASVPHVRDEIHIFSRNFETFIGENSDIIGGFFEFKKTILQQPTNDPLAPVPIAWLWDTNRYDGTNPPGGSEKEIGLAEFTNANFFSEGTITKMAFENTELPLPAIDRLILGPSVPDSRTGKIARYLSKINDGVSVVHMVRVDSLYDSNASFDYALDDFVYRDYAAYLLPRAIGYSAGILDYFFRGKIKIEAPDRFVYALAKYEEGNTGAFTKMRFKVSNDTEYPNTNEDTQGAGQMWAVVRYRKPTSGNLFENPYAGLSEPYYAVSAPQSVGLTRTSQELLFDFSTNPIPTNSADIFLWVVWQGRLGQEDEAIMVGGKDLLEPDPLTFGNASDYDCFGETLYHVADLTSYPPYNPPNFTQRDVTNDGYQDLFGAFTIYGNYIKTYDLDSPQIASPTNFDFMVTELQATGTGPQYSRFVLLQDKPIYGLSWRIGQSIDTPTGRSDNIPKNYDFETYSNFNYFEIQNDGTFKKVTRGNMIYRGVPTFSIYIDVVEGFSRYGPCLGASFLLPEPFTRVEGTLAPE
jgi:hypothetical protein